MRSKYIILLYLIVIITVIAYEPTVSFSYDTVPNEQITKYLIDLSRKIYNSINKSEIANLLYGNSNGNVKLKLLLSPSGKLKDAYVSGTSGNNELDALCLQAAWRHKKFPSFPKALGKKELWLNVPVIFGSNTDNRGTTRNVTRNYAEEVKPTSNLAKDIETIPAVSDKIGINSAVDIALENHLAAKIAEKEIELAKLKIRESNRALFPAAGLNYLETTGKTTGVTQDFTDKEYKLKFEYPLFYGWRLKYAVEQAVSNMKASTFNYDKVLQDLRVEVETAFYSYIASKMNLKVHNDLLKETEAIYVIAEKRMDKGLITRAEFLQVESQIKQIKYQIISSENEMIIARLTLMQAMNVGDGDKDIDEGSGSFPTPHPEERSDEGSLKILQPFGLQDEPSGKNKKKNSPRAHIDILDGEDELKPVEVNITLDECMDMAFKSRPDIKAKEHMVEFNDYERKIAKSKEQFKVDLTGTYGKSGGAYETESLTLGTDWYLGLKVSKPFGGNTFSTAYTEDKTSQKHGQSTRTESTTQSVEIGLLDNIHLFSEQKSAEIALEKAREELQQIKDNVLKEVKEAYLNYKKGFAQVMTNLNKIEYREEELKIAKVRAGLNEMSLSELLQAYTHLSDERSYYIEALGGMYQSLAKLNKSTGYTLFLDSKKFIVANSRKRE